MNRDKTLPIGKTLPQRILDEFAVTDREALVARLGASVGRDEDRERGGADSGMQILDALPAQIGLLDPKGRVSFINKAWRDFAVENGAAEAQIAIGQDYIGIGNRARGQGAEEARKAAQGIKSVLNGETDFFSLEYSSDGLNERRWFDLLVAPMPRSSGRGAIVMHINVTTRKLAEALRRDSEAQFQTLSEAMPQIVWMAEPDGSITYINQQWTAYTGLGADESLDYGWVSSLHPDDLERAKQVWQHAMTTMSTYTLEYRLRRFDGTYRWWLTRGVTLENDAGNVVKWIGTSTDVHEIKESQRRLDEQAALLDKAGDAIFVLNLDYSIRYWNRSAEQLYGWTSQEVLGRSVEDLLYRDYKRFQQTMSATLVSGEWLGEVEHYARDGKAIIVESRRSLVRDEQENPQAILVINTDVTQRRTIEEQLRQSQKLDAVGKLTGGVAHDFNNILMVIIANVDAMLEDEKLAADTKSRLERIGGAAERATQLTRQLLAFSRKQTLQPKRTSLNDLVTATGTLLRRTLGEHIEINSLLAEDLWPANVDRGQVEAALINLCVNARDAMPEGGRLLVETKNVVLDEAYASHNPDASAGDYVMLSVTDTGTGMAPEVVAKVFEPFFTTKDVGKGTGLGLSMVYGFARQSSGHVKIYSEVGYGTTVKLYLPRDAQDAPLEMQSSVTSMPRGTERILVVEDEEPVRAILVQQLSSLGYDVRQAVNGAEGLEILRSGQACDLLLTDVVMPGPVSGTVLADEARLLLPGLGVLFMSGYSEDAISTLGILNPGVALLNKPFRKVDLALAVRRAIDSTHVSAPA
jgi:PAS domain S-box-containing protein